MIESSYSHDARATVFHGDRIDLLKQIPNDSAKLIVTSPPYGIGKEYEKKQGLDAYLSEQRRTLIECVTKLHPRGSLCWQVGNYIDNGEVYPLDIYIYDILKHTFGMKLRNRVVWHFEHGLHCKNRLSGRYETILWFTKTDDYYFNLDPIRVPQKYPNKKHYKGPNKGQLSGNPLGKSPGDLWSFPNVKHNHVEKTAHPCQFPVELVERLVLSMTEPGDLVVDPYFGVGSSGCAALMHGRRIAGSDTCVGYLEIAKERLEMAAAGTLKTRPMDREVLDYSSKTPCAL